ncbi:MAG: hypothetical protein K5762_03830 [Bacilli bacterium]|jgi:hypothetical protein|nr:hypothetical protein [Bacilli bacterium]
MHNEAEFKMMIGDALLCCQTIEHDVKWIFACMMQGDLKENYALLSTWTLGSTIKELEKLDHSDNKPFIQQADYRVLKKISNERNYIAHQCFRDFLYTETRYDSREFIQVDKRITLFYNKLKKLSLNMEQLRLAALRRFRKLKA